MENSSKNAFIPLLVLTLTVAVWFTFQTIELYREHGRLQVAKQGQEETMGKAQKMRDQLDAIASGTQKLADKGNTNAQSVVSALKARGISINANPITTQQKDAPK
jgi:hypothetical protein